MTLVAAAVCPHPPLIIPEVAAGAAPELDRLRSACDAAVDGLWATQPDAVVVIGGDTRTGWCAPDAAGSLAGFGVDLRVPLQPRGGADACTLPLSVTVGAWLIARRPVGGPVSAATLARDAPSGDCAAFGERLAARAGRVGLLVMGDGSARCDVTAPGYHDPQAEAYDAAVARALAAADIEALLGLDRALSARLWAAGRAPWQALAGAARATGGRWTGDLRYHAAPYGVAYFVASWERV